MAMSACVMMAQTENSQNASSESAAASVEQLLVYENPKIYITAGEIKYLPKKAIDKAQNTVVDVAASIVGGRAVSIPVEDEGMVPAAIEAIQSALARPLRFSYIPDGFTQQHLDSHVCLVLSATITGCNSTVRVHDTYNDKFVLVTAFINLTDQKTGEVVANKQVSGWVWAGTFSTFDAAKNAAIQNLYVDVVNSLNRWYPLRGHMLEKGFQKGKKQKLKEIYIDLGNVNGLGTGYTCDIYTVRRIAGRIARKYIGGGKVVEVLGDDISTVQLNNKGSDYIKEAFDNGAEIAVSVY